jgi:hypothetical protein
MAAVKLLSHGSPGKGAEELKRRLKNNELTPSDVRPIAEKLAENQLWSTVDRLTELDLLDKNTNAQLRTAYPKMIRPTFQLFDEAFCDDLRKKKMAPKQLDKLPSGCHF